MPRHRGRSAEHTDAVPILVAQQPVLAQQFHPLLVFRFDLGGAVMHGPRGDPVPHVVAQAIDLPARRLNDFGIRELGSGQSQKLLLGRLPSGTYFLEFKGEGYRFAYKVVAGR